MFISSNPNNTTTAEHVTDIVNQSLRVLVQEYQSKIDKAVARANEVGFPNLITDIVDCKEFSQISSPDSYTKTEGYYSRERTVDEVVVAYTKILDDARAKLELTHATNIPKIESNKELSKKLTALFTSLGFSATERKVDTKHRGWKTKYIETTSGWASSIYAIKTGDGYEGQLNLEKCLRKALEDYTVKAKKVEEERRIAAEADKKKERHNRALGVILARHDLEADTTVEDAIDALLIKNKYLRLAHYILMNRNEWSSGYDQAEQGLNGFTVETDEDVLIHEAISRILANDDVDGRYFRDNKFGYDFLFGKAAEMDASLVKDYNKLSEMSETL